MIILIVITLIYLTIKRYSASNENRFIGSLRIPCLENVRVKFYQSTQDFVQYQGLRYIIVTKSGNESEWHTLGGTDDFNGAVHSDFEVMCKDSNLVVSYAKGSLIDSITIFEVLKQSEVDQ